MMARGEAHTKTTLTEADVLRLRRRHYDGATYRALAQEFRISRQTAWNICNRITWKHLQ